MTFYRAAAVVLGAVCVLSLCAEAAEYTWGGAGSKASPVFWDDPGNNGLPDHWASIGGYSPNVAGVDNVLVPSGGLLRTAVLIEGPSSLTLTGGYLYTGGFDVGKIAAGGTLVLDGGELDCQWFSVYPGSAVRLASGLIKARGGNEPMPDRGGGYVDFTGDSGTLTTPNKGASYLEGKILAGLLRIDGVRVASVGEVVNGRHFVVEGTTVRLAAANDWIVSEPSPGHGAEDVAIEVVLAWTAPGGVTGCNVYFGTDAEVGANPKVVDGELVESYAPGKLAYATTYYWRVDTHADGLVHEGPTWRFTTVPELTHTLVAHWDLEEGVGARTVAAVGSPAADGTLNGCTWVTNGLPSVPTGTSAALQFDAAADDHVVTGFGGVTGTRARTVALWIKANPAPTENATLVSWGSPTDSNRYSFRLNSATQGTPYALRLEIQSTYAIAQTRLDDGQWHHVAVAHEAQAGIYDVRFYVDGVLEDGLSGWGATNAVINTGTDSPVVLGSSFQNITGYGFDGAMDDMRIYDYALSVLEVEDLVIGTVPRPVNPEPVSGAVHVDTAATLRWEVINASAPTFTVNVGTDAACVDVAARVSTGGIASYPLPAGLFDYGTTYYWRVDVTDGGEDYAGAVWVLTTGGAASDPDPADGAAAKDEQRRVSWVGDAMAASYNVYAGAAEPLHFVGNYVATTVSFKDVAAALSLVRLPEGADVRWRVDCLDDQGAVMTTGAVWTFRVPISLGETYGVLDDFDGYVDDADLAAIWTTTSGASIALDELTNVMECSYDCTAFPNECAIQRVFDPPADWRYDEYRSLQINFRGDEQNDPETMYVVLSDGTHSARLTYEDSSALTDCFWRTWDIPLSAFGGVDMAGVGSIRIGFGDKNAPGGAGLVRFNDILLYPSRCIEGLTAAGDLDGDCAIDMSDLLILAGDWLQANYAVAAESPGADGLRVWYQFDETGGAAAGDSSGNANDGAIVPTDAAGMWSADGHDGGCLELDNRFDLVIPAAAFSDVDQAVTISMWVNGLAAGYDRGAAAAVFAAGGAPVETSVWDRLVWDIDGGFGGAGPWNHYAFVKDAAAGLMRIYRNGLLVAQHTSAWQGLSGVLAGDTVLRAGFADSSIKVDDLRIYDRGLSQAEVLYLATGAAGGLVQPVWPVLTGADADRDGGVGLADFATLAAGWMSECLWPE